jgi:hypothetical protein
MTTSMAGVTGLHAAWRCFEEDMHLYRIQYDADADFRAGLRICSWLGESLEEMHPNEFPHTTYRGSQRSMKHSLSDIDSEHQGRCAVSCLLAHHSVSTLASRSSCVIALLSASDEAWRISVIGEPFLSSSSGCNTTAALVIGSSTALWQAASMPLAQGEEARHKVPESANSEAESVASTPARSALRDRGGGGIMLAGPHAAHCDCSARLRSSRERMCWLNHLAMATSTGKPADQRQVNAREPH